MKDKLQTDIERAARAEQIMNDPLMVEARETIEAELWRLFKTAVPTDFEALSQIKSMQYMHKCISDGKLARMELERKKKTLRERFIG